MNRIYRLVWSSARNAWMVAAEGSRARGKGTSLRNAAVAAAMATSLAARPLHADVLPANALPTAGRVAAGQASIATSGATTTVTQGSDKAILHWGTFNIGSAAAVQFVQPGAGSVALNRVVGPDPSQILGRLTANGSVFLVNPSGVLFGSGAKVDVGGLVASTLDIADNDFLAGTFRFARGASLSSVVNQGHIAGGYVALLAPEVRNEGVIVARQGTVALAAGDGVTLGIAGSRLVGVEVDRASIDTLVENRRLIQVDEGTVLMSAQSARGLVGRVVNTDAIDAQGISTDGGTVRLLASSEVTHSGAIRADAGTQGKGGDVRLVADLANPDSKTTFSGSISARGGSAGGDGGFVDTSASRVQVAGGARVDTRAAFGRRGEWLIDPTDYTIAASGGDITGADLQANLGTTDVIIESTNGASGTNGDIFVNDAVSWSNATLTLRAQRDVNVNATLAHTGTGGLAVEYGQGAVAAGNGAYFTANAPVNLAASSTFSTKLGSDGSVTNYVVVTDLAGLTAIDATGTSVQQNYALGANIVISSGTWTPIGNTVGPFQGIFEGLGHTVSGITYDSATAGGVDPHQFIGLFGQTTSTAQVRNIGVTGVNLKGRTNVGALVGSNQGSIYNAFSTGTVGLDSGVSGTDTVFGIGGLVGVSLGTIERSRSEVTVSASGGDQSMGMGAGGGIGGLAGVAQAKVSNSYATGAVTGDTDVGGLVGHATAPVEHSYATGKVIGTTNAGGLVGSAAFAITVTDSYWDETTSELGARMPDEYGINRVSADMKVAANFSTWDTTRVWKLENGSYPVFISGPAAVGPSAITISLNDSTRVYGNTAQPALTGFAFTGTLKSGDALTGAGWGTALTDYLAVGEYAYSTANLIAPTFTFGGGHTIADYTVSYSANKLTVTPRPLTLTPTGGQGKVYNGQAGGDPALTYAITTSTLVNGDTLSGALARAAGNNVGTYAINQGTLANANYAITLVPANFAITPKALSVSGSAAAGRDYNGTTAAAITVGTLSGFLDSETVTATATGTFDSKDAGARTATAAYTLANGTNNGLAANYSLANTTGHAATITPKALSVAGTTVVNRAYDGGTDATFNLGTLSGFVNSETVTATAAGSFDDKNAGARTATATYTLANGSNGGLAANYSLAPTAGLAGTITPKALTIAGVSASSRAYDGSTTAAITGGTLSGFIGSETVTATAAGTFDSKDAGARTATAAYTLANGNNGGLAANYSLANTTGLAATISPKALTVTGTTAAGREYDGTTAAAITVGTLSGLVAGETVSATATGTFDSKNAGARTATAAYTLANGGGGGLAGNYTLANTTGHAATISPKALSLLDLTFEADLTSSPSSTVLVGDQAALTSGSVPAGPRLATDSLAVTFTPNTVDAKTITATAVSGVTPGRDFDQYTVTANAPTATIALGGADAANYTLTGTTVQATVEKQRRPTTTTRPPTTSTRPPRAEDFEWTTVAPTTRPPQERSESSEEFEESNNTTPAPPPTRASAGSVQSALVPGEVRDVDVESDVAFDPDVEPEVTLGGTGDSGTPPEAEVVATVDADGQLKLQIVVPEGTEAQIISVSVVATDSRGVKRTIVYLFPVTARGG